MGLSLQYKNGQTLIEDEEKKGLRIVSIFTQKELNEMEQLNIEKAMLWIIRRKFKRAEILSVDFIRKIHKKMFGDVWTWAGEFRTTEKDIGVKWSDIPMEIAKLLEEVNFWIDNKTYAADEIAIRFKHRLVSIHCFSNGNGRHSRVLADIIIEHIFNRELFTWSRANLYESNSVRSEYINAMKLADQGNMLRLMGFARS